MTNVVRQTCIVRQVCPCCGNANVIFQRRMAHVDILECNGCGSAFSKEFLPNGTMDGIYNKLYAECGLFEEHRKEVARMRQCVSNEKRLTVGWERKRFFRRTRSVRCGSLLDIGCGTGLFLLAAKRKGWRPVGVEVSGEAAKLGQQIHGCRVHVGRMEDVDLPVASFDAITAWEVAEHISEPRELLLRVLRLLKPGGSFAGSIPDYARPKYRHGVDLGPLSIPPIHLNFWTAESFRRFLQGAGLCEIEISAPRLTLDLLRPLGRVSVRKVARFLSVAFGRDVVSSFFFGSSPKELL